MTRRTTEHETAQSARKAFEAIVPNAWTIVSFDGDPDYGIDQRVEIFRSGETTGEVFYVQLKGTLGDASSMSIKKRHLEYWSQLLDPVLIASVDANTGEIFHRWAHSVPQPLGKSTTVHFDKVQPDFTQRVESTVRFLHMMRRRKTSYPILVEVQNRSTVSAADCASLAAALCEIAEACGFNDILHFSPDACGIPTVEVHSDGWKVDFGGWSVSARDGAHATEPAHIVAACGLALGGGNRPIEGLRVLTLLADAGAPFHWNPQSSGIAGGMVRSARDVRSLLKLERTMVHDAFSHAAFFLNAALDWRLSSEDVQLLESSRVADLEAARVSGRGHAVAAYNLARLRMGRDRHLAVKLFEEAMKADPAMGGRAFFAADFGLCLAFAGNASDAKRYLRIAADAGHLPATRELYRQLFHEADYEEAFTLASARPKAQTVAASDVEVGLWTSLAQWAIRSDIVRKATAAARITHQDLPVGVEAARHVLNTAQGLSGEDRYYCYLFQALVLPNDVETWACALAASLISEFNPEASLQLAQTAGHYVGLAVATQLEKTLQGAPRDLIAPIVGVIRDAVAARPSSQPQFHFTFQGDPNVITLTPEAARVWPGIKV